jgi:hypothetical protein
MLQLKRRRRSQEGLLLKQQQLRGPDGNPLIGKDPTAIQTKTEQATLRRVRFGQIEGSGHVNLAQLARVNLRRLARPVEAV